MGGARIGRRARNANCALDSLQAMIPLMEPSPREHKDIVPTRVFMSLVLLTLLAFVSITAPSYGLTPVSDYNCPNDNSNNGHYVPANHYWEQEFTSQGTSITGGSLLLGANVGDHDHTARIGIYTGANRSGALEEIEQQVVGYGGVNFTFPTPIAVSPGQQLHIAATGVGDFTAYDELQNGVDGCFIGRIDGYSSSSTEQPTPSASTGSLHHVYHTCANGACGLRVRAGPGYSHFAQVGSKNDGDAVLINCQIAGESVFGLDGSYSNVWDRLVDGTFVADFYIDTPGVGGAFSPGIPQCDPGMVPEAPPAAPSAYAVTSTNGLKRRLAPFTNASFNGAIAYGAKIIIDCQISSEAFGGSSVWDRTSDGYWFPDAFVDTPGHNGDFSSNIMRCSGDAPPSLAGVPAGGSGPVTSPPIASGPAPTCKQDIVFIGARGSGEGDTGFGATVYAAVGPVLSKFGTSRVILDGLDHSYPALSIRQGALDWLDFARSVASGTTAILTDMGFHISRFRAAHCTNALHFFLAGYSQGAWAVGDAYLEMSQDFRQDVVGMVLFGDPRNHGNILFHGIYDAGHPWGEGISGNVWNSCRTFDPVCHADALTTIPRVLLCLARSTCDHYHYADVGQQASQAGRWLASLIN